MQETFSNRAYHFGDLRGARHYPLEMVGGSLHAGHRRSHHVSHMAGSTWTLRVASKRTPDYRPHRPGVRMALPRPLTLVMMASLLMEEGALNKFQYIGMVAFLAMRLYDYHHRYLCRPLSIVLCMLWTIHLPAAPVFCCLVYLLPSFPLCDAEISATEKALDISQDAGQSVRSVIDNSM